MQTPLPANAQFDVPDGIRVPAGEQMVLKVHAYGVQIYTCQEGGDGKFTWTLKAPEAELRDDNGEIIGYHSAGPSWRHNDGSEVTGKAVARVDSADSIPWLLVSVVAHSGNGVLSGVTTIQRVNTSGGQPPATTECDGGKQNAEVKISYTADYYFYAPAK
jgi:hypothetical protein